MKMQECKEDTSLKMLTIIMVKAKDINRNKATTLNKEIMEWTQIIATLLLKSEIHKRA